MAVTHVRVRLGTVAVPAGAAIDRDDLCRRVEVALAALLEAEPLATAAPLALPSLRTRSASAPTAAGVAHALARRIHAELRRNEARA